MDATQSSAPLSLYDLTQAVKMSPVRLAGGAGIVLSVALLLIAAMVLTGSGVRVLDLVEKADAAQQTLTEIDALQEDLSNAGVAARARALRHETAIAEARDQARVAIRQHIIRLETAFASDPDGKRQLEAAERLIGRRLAMYEQMSSTGAAPLPTLELERIRLAHASNAMVAGLRARTAADLSDRQRRIAADMRVAMGVALFAAATAPFVGLIGIHLLRRERDSRRSRELQLELMHVQRLAIMGETSTMLAHEISQPLTAANNYLSLLRRHIEAGAVDKAQSVVERIAQQIQRASAILGKLRHFIEKREVERSIESPQILVDDAIALLGTLDPHVKLETSIEPGLRNVLVDRVQMQQVLVNLMRNAIEAMQVTPRQELHLAAKLRGDDLIEFSLADSGPGLSPEIAARLFQPFVTSKANGMGVGLSISRRIIERHGGTMWAEANSGGGTVFRFTLPAFRDDID